MMQMRHTLVFPLAMLAAAPLFAHGMHLEVRVDAQARIVGTARYGSHAVANAQVQVLALDGKVLATGTTDGQGAFAIPFTQRVDVRVAITDGGHRGEKALPASAFPSSLPASGGALSLGTADASNLSAVVEAAVAKRLDVGAQ